MNVRNLKHILLSIFSDFKSVFQNMMIEFVELLLIDMYVYVFIYIYIYIHIHYYRLTYMICILILIALILTE
jgi:hypothetical protein